MPSPPLPSSLSTRFLSSMNPHTGTCKRHLSVQLCELVENNSRWVVRRKICSKCGVHAPVGARRTRGVVVRKGDTPRSTTRSHSAPPASDGRQSATPVRRRLSCDERQGDTPPNLVSKSFKSSRPTSTTSRSFSKSGSGTEFTNSTSSKFEAKKVRKPKAPRKNKKMYDEAKSSIVTVDGSGRRHHRLTSRIKGTSFLSSVDTTDVSPRQVSFSTPPKTELPYIPPPPLHNQVLSKYRSRKQSSINTEEDDIIKNVGYIYFYPT